MSFVVSLFGGGPAQSLAAFAPAAVRGVGATGHLPGTMPPPAAAAGRTRRW